jgi:hypothetical protein
LGHFLLRKFWGVGGKNTSITAFSPQQRSKPSALFLHRNV